MKVKPYAHIPQRANPWQPISTAPRDGTAIDIWAGGHRIPDCSWQWGGKLLPGGENGPEGWRPLSRDYETLAEPTHWMEIPKPPV